MTDLNERLRAAFTDRYTIGDELGAGGMATVYMARDLKHHRKVAIKVMSPELAAVLGPERFLREIEIAARLTHPHILPLHDSGQANGLLFYVMPYLEGGSLGDRLKRVGRLRLEDAIRIAREVADGLDYAHAEGVVHRDIKPGNILMSRGHALIADFGVARALRIAGADAVTAPGLAVGTPSYMSPEQAGGEVELDGRSDLYSLGCVVYETLTGKPPYTGTTAQAIIAKRATDPIPSVRAAMPSIPDAVDEALKRALAKTPDQRFPSATSFSEALASPAAASKSPGARRYLPAAGVAALLLVVVAAWVVGRLNSSGAGLVSITSVAVFPFSYHGSPEYAYLDEGIVELLNTKLEVPGVLRTLNQNALLSLGATEDRDPFNPESRRSATRRLSGDLYIVGGVVEVGGTITITAELHDTEDDAVATRTEAAGNVDETLQLAEHLARQLLADYLSDPRVTMASVTTDSLSAFKAYIEGSRWLRVGRFDSAGLAFERAVDTDSAFSLAWEGLSIALGFGFTPQSQFTPGEALEAAVRHGGGLPQRTRQLLEGRLAMWRRSPWEAERTFRRIVGAHPDDFDAWFALLDIGIHHGLRNGRPIEEVRQVVERTIDLVPSHPMALGFRLWVAQVERDSVAIDSLTGQLVDRDPQQDIWTRYYRAVRTFRSGDRAAIEELMEELSGESDLWVYFGAYAAALEADSLYDALTAARLMTAPSRGQWRLEGQSLLAHLKLGRGNWATALEEIDATERMDRDYGLRTFAMLLLARNALVVIQPTELEEGLRRVETWAPLSPEDSLWRSYFLGQFNATLGDHAEVTRFAAELDNRGTTHASNDASSHHSAMARDFGFSVRAHAALRRGDPQKALELLEQASPWEWWPTPANFVLFEMWTFERFIRAEMLTQLDRDEEALHWYGALGLSPFELVYEGAKHLRMGQIYERLNQPDKARDHYARVLRRWRDADPEFRPLIGAARDGIVRLDEEAEDVR